MFDHLHAISQEFKIRMDGRCGQHMVEHIGCDRSNGRAIDLNIRKLISFIGLRYKGQHIIIINPTGVVVHHLAARDRQGAANRMGIGDQILLTGKNHGNGMVCLDIIESIAPS